MPTEPEDDQWDAMNVPKLRDRRQRLSFKRSDYGFVFLWIRWNNLLCETDSGAVYYLQHLTKRAGGGGEWEMVAEVVNCNLVAKISFASS